MFEDQRQARWSQLHPGSLHSTKSFPRARHIPGGGRDPSSGRRQPEAEHRGRGRLPGRPPQQVRGHGEGPAAQTGDHPGAVRHGEGAPGHVLQVNWRIQTS